MANGFPDYDKRSRFPKQQPKGICRGCCLPIDPKVNPYARTWHPECSDKFDPFYVKQAVRKRCGDKCEFCGKDCSRGAIYQHKFQKPKYPNYHETGLSYPLNITAFHAHPLYQEYIRQMSGWRKSAPSPEFDHILPHSEGGHFILENIRLLCRGCHLKRTREWHKARKKKSAPLKVWES